MASLAHRDSSTCSTAHINMSFEHFSDALDSGISVIQSFWATYDTDKYANDFTVTSLRHSRGSPLDEVSKLIRDT